MLEAYLFTYKNQFGEDFPLADFEYKPEKEVIDILYRCLQTNTPLRRAE